MKIEQKRKALQMRSGGSSIKDIAKTVGVAKSSVSIWVRDIELTATQRAVLTAKGKSVDAIERNRKARIANTLAKREALMHNAAAEVGEITRRELLLSGDALYWGEGGKSVRGGLRMTNSDPFVIQFCMRFFREVCEVPESKFRGHIHTFSHRNASVAEKYWSAISGIPANQLFKTYVKKSSASKNKRDSLPHGTFCVYVLDTKLFFRILGLIDGLKNHSTYGKTRN